MRTSRRTGAPVREAVALQYRAGRDRAPRVVAKGRGRLADRIIRCAESHDVAVIVDSSLVALLRGVPLQQTVPTALYPLVAEVLAFVYSVAKRSAPDRRHE